MKHCNCEICQRRRDKFSSFRFLGMQVGSGSLREEYFVIFFFQIFMFSVGVKFGLEFFFSLIQQ